MASETWEQIEAGWVQQKQVSRAQWLLLVVLIPSMLTAGLGLWRIAARHSEQNAAVAHWDEAQARVRRSYGFMGEAFRAHNQLAFMQAQQQAYMDVTQMEVLLPTMKTSDMSHRERVTRSIGECLSGEPQATSADTGQLTSCEIIVMGAR